MAVVVARGVSDADLAFQMQLNEALAASMGIDTIDTVDRARQGLPGAIEADAALACSVQEMELEAVQRQEEDRGLAATLVKRLSEAAELVRHDEAVARQIDEMADEEWEENGDLFEKPFQGGGSGGGGSTAAAFFRVFFKGNPVSDGGVIVGAAIGGCIMDWSGNELLQIKRYVGVPIGKNLAQYFALVEVLNAAHSIGARNIIAYTDSRAVNNQLKGYWKVTTKAMKAEYTKATALIAGFDSFDVNLALHGENWPADNLAKLVSVNQRQSAASSSKSMFQCLICFEDVLDANIYALSECSHRFCSSCVKKHVEATVTSGRTFPVACPQVDCGQKFTEDECKSLLSEGALKIFMKKIEEERIPDAQRVYCPYPNCSHLMDRRTFTQASPRKLCGACSREFCLNCRVPWHAYSTCQGYQRLPLELKDAEDAKLYKLAENQNWRQCKQCRRMIELMEGCHHMTCKCGHEFCYVCGWEYRNKIQTCSCNLWDERNIIRQDEEDDLDEEEVFDDEDSVDYGSEDYIDRVYKTQLCRFFARGQCRFGNRCRFAHGTHELR